MRGNGWAVYSPDGIKLLAGAGDKPSSVRLIGSELFVVGSGRGWQQHDLRTGVQGKACHYDLNYPDYIGTDGAVVVAESGNPNVGRRVQANDLVSCDTLWTRKSPIGSFRQVWRVNTTLLQLSDDGAELISLVAPR